MQTTSKLALFVAAIGLSTAALAADGTVNFTGKVTAQTCTVADGSKDKTVTLPTVPTSALASSGTTAGDTAFTLQLTDCSAGDVYTYFLPGANVLANGNLKNTAGTSAATNVEIALYNADNSKILLGQPAASQNSKPVNLSAGGQDASMNYVAKYFATGVSTAGDVASSVDFNIAYK